MIDEKTDAALELLAVKKIFWVGWPTAITVIAKSFMTILGLKSVCFDRELVKEAVM